MQPQTRSLGANTVHDAFSLIFSRKARLCSSGNLKNLVIENSIAQQLPQIAILPAPHRERKPKINRQDTQHILRLLLKDDFPRIWGFLWISAASPIHTSNFSSASSRSNQRACALASVPMCTFMPCPASSR
jgi:hypothetical protein